MDVDVLFAGAAVTDFEKARAWYERFFRPLKRLPERRTRPVWTFLGVGGPTSTRSTPELRDVVPLIGVE
jgi:hypothetical protein